MSNASKALEAHRQLEPELYAKADHIAKIIDPGAFVEWRDGTSPDSDKVLLVRQEYMKAKALCQAFEILRFLGMAPETTNWDAIFERMKMNEDEHV